MEGKSLRALLSLDHDRIHWWVNAERKSAVHDHDGQGPAIAPKTANLSSSRIPDVVSTGGNRSNVQCTPALWPVTMLPFSLIDEIGGSPIPGSPLRLDDHQDRT